MLFKDSIQVGLRVSSPSVQHFRDERIQEEELVRRFYPLKLQFDHMIASPVALTLRHVIDGNSPLYGMTPEDLKTSDTRLMASIVCIDTVIPAPVQSATDYSYDDILWNRRFAEIYAETPDGRLTVDYSRIHDTEEVEIVARRPPAGNGAGPADHN